MKRRQFLRKALRVARISRLIAKLIDIFISIILIGTLGTLGVLISIAYFSLCDSLQNGQSVGKRLMGFAVISLEDGMPCSMKQSFIRNLPFIAPLIFAIVPLWGWVIGLILWFPLMILELYLMFKIDSGHRLGDVMADTSVMANDGDNIGVKKKSSWFDGEMTAP